MDVQANRRNQGPSIAHFFLVPHRQNNDELWIDAVPDKVATVAKIDDPLTEFFGHVVNWTTYSWLQLKHI